MRKRLGRREFLAATGGAASALWTRCGSESRTPDFVRTRKDALRVLQQSPFNAQPPLEELVGNWLTPIERFYVRNHAPVPRVDADDYRLIVQGLVQNPFQASLAELQERLERVSATATLTCAGNRRQEHSASKPVPGVPWGAGAIGNALWEGYRLSDLLREAAVEKDATHIWLDGLDQIDKDGRMIPFGATIPVEKAMSDDAEGMPGTMLAVKMNGEPLPPDHGFPLRAVVPGYIGARSVKWLARIVASDRPSLNHYVTRAYKIVEEDSQWRTADPIREYRLNSAICDPAPNSRLEAGPATVRGYALAPGRAGHQVDRVQVSADGGQSWVDAEITSPVQAFCWQIWKASLEVGPDTQSLIVRAWDSEGRVQPEKVDWNLKGYLYNAWHRVPVQVS